MIMRNDNTENTLRELTAKLMAAENVNVIHDYSASTAAFDIRNRDLVLPVLKNCSHELYTLFITHEVGHAIYTDQEETLEFFRDNKNLVGVLNVFEDVRIEKLIQKKYPGTQRCFASGYMDLFSRNFFGTQDRDVNSFNLLDRINLHFKVGSYNYCKIPFTDDEMIWVDKANQCETFADVVKLSLEFAENFSTEPQKESSDQSSDDNDSKDEKNNDKKSSCDSESGDENDSEETENSSESNASDNTDQSSEMESESGATEDFSANPENQNLTSETQKSFDRTFSDECFNNNNFYSENTRVQIVDLPTFNLDEIIVSYKDVHSGLQEHKNRYANDESYNYRQNSKQLVNSMANVFERKKSADLYSKARTDKTGVLDVNKIHSYRYNDDIFKKNCVIPEGKSHGLVMFFDMSSSMASTISGCIDQIMSLVLFCRRVNIAFDVYGFTDCKAGSFLTRSEFANTDTNLLINSNFSLRHYFSNKMTNVEFLNAIDNMEYLKACYSGSSAFYVPSAERLGGTPLIPCIASSIQIIEQFKAQNNLDIVSSLYLTDGGDNHGIKIRDAAGCVTRIRDGIIQDPKTKMRWKFNSRYYATDSQDATTTLLKIVKAKTDARIIGYDLVRYIPNGYEDSIVSIKNSDMQNKFFKKNNFVKCSSVDGYDSLYFIKYGNSTLDSFDANFDHSISSEVIESNDKKAIKKAMKSITKEFNSHMGQRNNKIFIDNFIGEIA